ncbi:M28 family metallopeptidase [Novosphingobium sp.]|uniref:M28 family metallopeptidase n=1 Tax=Novosphingobium sp. TaxID=1874826 RepID=UPI0025FA1B1D|nr:M28 family metallopeptidase [Novosphingobium sp.]
MIFPQSFVRFPLRAITLASASLLVAATGPQAAIPHVATPAVDVPLMKDVVKTLSSDALEGRGPSTRAEPKVLDTIIAQFKAAGLKPGVPASKGKPAGWLQDVPTVEMTGTHHTPLTITGGGAPLSFAYGSEFVAGSYRVVPHTEIAPSELVFVGHGVNAPELGWNDYAGVDMHGKIAVILVNDPDYREEGEVGLFKGRRMTYYGRWTYKFEEAARQGAVGALIVHDTFPAAYGWNVVQSSWSGAQYFVAKANNAMDQTEVNGWVQLPVAQKIFAAAGQDLTKLTEAATHKGFRAVPLGVKASLGFDSAIRRSNSHNVVGILPGQTRPQEYVLYTAHWDHLGHCKPDAKGDGICNGAVDNATGVAALAALAKANVKAGAAARSQVFVSVTLEESGLLGSEWYAQHPVYPLARTVGGVNMDSLAPTGAAHDYAMTGGDKSDLTAYFRQALAEGGLVESPEDHPERGSYYRSDHFSLAKRGVPMFDLGRGTDYVNGGKAAGAAASEDYVEHRYHQPSDQYSPNWDWSGITADVQLYYKLGRMLATTTAWPNWHPSDEFRKARDASCAGVKGGC